MKGIERIGGDAKGAGDLLACERGKTLVYTFNCKFHFLPHDCGLLKPAEADQLAHELVADYPDVNVKNYIYTGIGALRIRE